MRQTILKNDLDVAMIALVVFGNLKQYVEINSSYDNDKLTLARRRG
jgi:hypothetical protein